MTEVERVEAQLEARATTPATNDWLNQARLAAFGPIQREMRQRRPSGVEVSVGLYPQPALGQSQAPESQLYQARSKAFNFLPDVDLGVVRVRW